MCTVLLHFKRGNMLCAVYRECAALKIQSRRSIAILGVCTMQILDDLLMSKQANIYIKVFLINLKAN